MVSVYLRKYIAYKLFLYGTYMLQSLLQVVLEWVLGA